MAKKTAARKTQSKKATPKKTSAAKKTTAKKTAAQKSAGTKASAKKTTAKKPAAAKKTTAKKTTRSPAPREAPRRVPPAPRASPTRLAPAPTKPRPARPAKLDAKALEQIRAGLERELAQLRARDEELEHESFDATQSEITGEVGLDDDFADAGTATFERERDLSIRNNILDLIDLIERALRRLDEGTYGTCEQCGRPIDAARLKALPHALLCMDCKRREERAR